MIFSNGVLLVSSDAIIPSVWPVDHILVMVHISVPVSQKDKVWGIKCIVVMQTHTKLGQYKNQPHFNQSLYCTGSLPYERMRKIIYHYILDIMQQDPFHFL